MLIHFGLHPVELGEAPYLPHPAFDFPIGFHEFAITAASFRRKPDFETGAGGSAVRFGQFDAFRQCQIVGKRISLSDAEEDRRCGSQHENTERQTSKRGQAEPPVSQPPLLESLFIMKI